MSAVAATNLPAAREVAVMRVLRNFSFMASVLGVMHSREEIAIAQLGMSSLHAACPVVLMLAYCMPAASFGHFLDLDFTYLFALFFVQRQSSFEIEFEDRCPNLKSQSEIVRRVKCF